MARAKARIRARARARATSRLELGLRLKYIIGLKPSISCNMCLTLSILFSPLTGSEWSVEN